MWVFENLFSENIQKIFLKLLTINHPMNGYKQEHRKLHYLVHRFKDK